MSCTDFETRIHAYLDETLTNSEMSGLREHFGDCNACRQRVTDLQHTRALLSTAVTDAVAAVDVSGIWKGIEQALEGEFSGAAIAVPATRRLREHVRAAAERMHWRPVPAWRFAAWGAAAVAAVALVVVSMPSEPQRVQVAAERPAVERTGIQSVRVDALETAAGHSVATWVQPRTNTRVIWVADTQGFGVSKVRY